MNKRCASSNNAPLRKRLKTTDLAKTTRIRVPETEGHEIRSSRDLQVLLAFDQDSGPAPKQSKYDRNTPTTGGGTRSKSKKETKTKSDREVEVQSFTSFLVSIANATENDNRSVERALLLDYLQSQAPQEGKEAPTYLIDIIRTWHFAAQSNADSLFASVVAVLALLLKSISSLMEFRDYGNRLCTTLLHDDQVKLFNRGLGIHGAKDFLISPCLQLLTEIVSFDGGHAARTLYRQQEITLKRLDVFLGMREVITSGSVTGPKRRSIREDALRYLFANLRLQSSAAKINIITQRKFLRVLLDDIAEDSPSIISEILGVLRRDVIMDVGIPPTAKGQFFSRWTLSRLVTLYSYDESAKSSADRQNVQTSIHDFLILLCTSPGLGLVETTSAGKVGVNAVTANKALHFESFSQSHIADELEDDPRPTGRNLKLQSFLQSLRPFTSLPQRNLILAVFRSLPEIIPDYFSSSKISSFEPKLTTTWIGYSTFLIATIATPLPESLASSRTHNTIPHLYGNTMESIIPKPCNQRTLTRCLNQSVTLVKFFTLQILNAIFEKFARVLQKCEDSQHHAENEKKRLGWCQIVSKLRNDFRLHVPEFKHVITQFRSCVRVSSMLRESITRLVASYYKIMPEASLEEKFDISSTLSTTLVEVGSLDGKNEESSIRLLELEHLLEIAHRSPNMQWWHKPDSMRLSTFTMLLRLYLSLIHVDTKLEQLRILLKTIITESQILCSNTSTASLDRLIISLQDFGDWEVSSQVFEFLDHCILRLVRKPVLYYDMLADLIATMQLDVHPKDCQVDLLLMTLMDQWRFLEERADAPTALNVSQWLVRLIESMSLSSEYTESLPLLDETTKLLLNIRDHLKSGTQGSACRVIFEKTLKDRPELEILKKSIARKSASEAIQLSKPEDSPPGIDLEPPKTILPPEPQEEHEDYPGLYHWSRQDIQESISEGHVKALILCLCSKHAEVRKQALTGIRTFMIRLEGSRYIGWQQTYVLVGELVETAAKVITDQPLPFYAGILAAALLLVLGQPLHFMYTKANEFLNRAPEWNLTKLPSYWADRILMNSSTNYDGYYQEVEWLIDGLNDGLRTAMDMNMYHKCHIFDRLLSFSASPSLPEPCLQTIVDLLFRCTYVKGSSTLITHCGLMSWIFSRLASQSINDTTRRRLISLAWRAYETSSLERDDWSDGTFGCTMKLMTRRLDVL